VRRTIEVALRANIGQFQAQMGAAAAQVRGLSGTIGSTLTSADARTQQTLRSISRGALLLGGAMAAALGASIKAAINYESAFAGVAKTVDGTADQMAALSDGIRAMSRELPASAIEIAAVAEAAGQLGVRREDILGFTRVMVDLGETTNLTSDEAATSMAQLMNIMGTAGEDVDRLGSTLVELGNNGASTERDILELGMRLAGAGKMAGLSEADVLSFANALASMGIEAEAGGTAFSRVFLRINDAVIDGGEKLEVFSKTAGVSAEEFRRAYQEDASGAITMFVEGLGRVQASGQSTTAILEALELNEIRVSDALRRTAGNSDVLTQSLEDGRRAWEENTALVEEARKRYETTGAQLEIFWNNVTDAAVGFGEQALPAVKAVSGVTTDLIQTMAELPGPVQSGVAAFLGLGGATLLALGGIGILVPKIHQGRLALEGLGAAGIRANAVLGGIGRWTGYAGIALGLAAAITAVEDAFDPAPGVGRFTEELLGFLREGEAVGSLAQEFGRDLERVGEVVDGLDMKVGIAGLLGFKTSSEDSVEAVRALDQSLASLVSGGHPEKAAELLERFRRALTPEQFERLTANLKDYDEAQAQANVQQELAAEGAEKAAGAKQQLNAVTGEAIVLTEEEKAAQEAQLEIYDDLASALAGFVGPMDAYSRALEANQAVAESWAEEQNAGLEKTKVSWKDYPGLVKEGLKGEALEANKEKAREWAEAQNEAIGSASVTWEDFPGGVAVSLTQYADELQKGIDAQNRFMDNLGAIALRGREDVARELALMAEESPEKAAALAQTFVDTLGPEFDRAGDLLVESTRRTTQGIGRTADDNLKVLGEIARRHGDATVSELVKATGVLPEEVRRIAQEAGVALKEEESNWNNSWWRRRSVATDAMLGMQRDVPPVAGATADTANQEVARRSPIWAGTWGGYYGSARGASDAMRRDVPPIVGAASAGMVGALAGGLDPFRRTVGGYAGALEHGIRTVNVSAGASWANVPDAVRREFKGVRRADGAVVDYFASGGFKEKHVAEIARAGDWRVWAEPETGGEAYIPLSPGKRGRSVPIWLETGRRLGMDEDALYALREAQQFHSGGLWQVPGVPPLEPFGHPIRPRGEASLHSARSLAEAVSAAHMKLPHHQAPPPGVGGSGGLAGSTTGLNPEFLRRFMAYSDRVGPLRIVSGFRSRARQAQLYAAYLAGRGNLAAPPGRSKHERGLAIDHAPAANASMKAIAREFRLHYPVRGEPWHVEPFARGGFHGLRSYDRGGYLNPGYTLAHNGTGHPEMVVPSGGSSGPTTTVHLTVRNEITVDGELGPSSRRELERMQRENNAEIVAMVRQGVR
jgi:TP901 family phage tail tape measure protein